MKATGIVRRIDDLGRIVLPKEIRRTLRIREGDPLEIYTDREGAVVLKKFSSVEEASRLAEDVAASLYALCRKPVLVTDLDRVVAAAGGPRRELLGQAIRPELGEAIRRREVCRKGEEEPFPVLETGGEAGRACWLAVPILPQGDPAGAVVVYSREPEDCVPREVETAARLGALVLGKQTEG